MGHKVWSATLRRTRVREVDAMMSEGLGFMFERSTHDTECVFRTNRQLPTLHLTSDDFLSKWKKDVQELKPTKDELNKYKKIVKIKFSSEWREALSEEEKAKSKISKK